jgi:2-oxo-4-hydroxy-4-carboxy-5-ureidoimidazoline decarboxylase
VAETTDAALARFNAAPHEEAREAVRSCLDVPRWVDEMLAGRPYPTVDAALAAARTAAQPLTADEVDQALSRHPRIGERPAGAGAEAAMSRSEQSGVDPADVDVEQRLREGNEAYEARFGRVFLIRAAGRNAREILAALEQRLGNDDDTERLVVAEQLREIATLRLEGMLRR